MTHGKKDLTFKIFGLDTMGGAVFADVFAKKISTLISGLKAVDKISNGGKRHEYMITGLEIGSAKIEFSERCVSDKSVKRSPAAQFVSVGMAASSGRVFSPSNEAESEIIRIYDGLCKKSSRDFDYATIRSVSDDLIRVDSFLQNQVERIIRTAKAAAEMAPPKFFSGEAIGSFDGIIEAVDLKGDAPEARLILSAGGKPIDCVIFDMNLDEVREALGNRVAATGRAIYDGRTGLPSRIEIRSIKTFKKTSVIDLCGSLKPFEISRWGEVNRAI